MTDEHEESASLEAVKLLFGEESLSWTQLLERAEKAGVRLGDVAALNARHAEEIATLQQMAVMTELERGLERFGAKNGAIVKKALDLDAVRVENGRVTGLNEQLEALSRSDPYLFRERTGAKTGAEHGRTPPDDDSLSDVEYYKYKFKSF